MGIFSAIRRSKDDLVIFKDKSYSDIDIGYEIVDLSKLLEKKKLSEAKKRMFSEEYKEEGAKLAIRIFDKNKKTITVNQIKDIFDDIGFEVDVMLSDIFQSDIVMAYNIGGFVIPFWRIIVTPIIKWKPYFKNLLLTKISPGKKRLHCRIFEDEDASWYVISHVDEVNTINIFHLIGLYRSHFIKGAGNYKEGQEIMERIFEEFLPLFKAKRNIFVDAENIYEGISPEKQR